MGGPLAGWDHETQDLALIASDVALRV